MLRLRQSAEGNQPMTAPTQEQVQAMVDVWRAWNAETPGLRPSVNSMMRRAYQIAREMEAETNGQ